MKTDGAKETSAVAPKKSPEGYIRYSKGLGAFFACGEDGRPILTSGDKGYLVKKFPTFKVVC